MNPDVTSKSCKEILIDRVGFTPKDAIGWLYVARGMYKLNEYALVIEAVSHCLRNEKTIREAQHLLVSALMNHFY